VQCEISNITTGRAAWEACSATWNLGTNSAFALVGRCISAVFLYIDSFLISLIRLYKCLWARVPPCDMWADDAYGRITICYQIRASSVLYRVCRSGLDISCFLTYISFCVVGFPLCFPETEASWSRCRWWKPSTSILIFCTITWWWPIIRAETCREYKEYIIKNTLSILSRGYAVCLDSTQESPIHRASLSPD
jgi:hypothetical protein